MAEKIELDVGGKYSAGAVFNQMNADIKAAGKSMKDMGDGAVKVANGIADAVGEKVNSSLKSTIGIVGEMARGGIWGAMAAAATAAIGFVADKIKEAKEQAKQLVATFNEMMGDKYKDSFTAISDQLKTTKQEMAEATKEADAMLQALNGKVADSAKVQIAQLHVETLQKMTDATSEAAKKALEAQEAYVATVWKNNATMDQANNTLNAANAKRTAALTKYNATEEALEATKEQQRKLETVYSSQLQRRSQLQANIEQWTIESSLSEQKAKENADHLAWAREQLALLEEQNKEVFAQHAAGLQQINALETELASSDIELTNANRAVTAATRHLEVVKNENAASEAEAKSKRDALNLAAQQELDDEKVKSEQNQRKAEIEETIAKIKAEGIEKDRDYNQWLDLARKALEEGYSEQTALNVVRARYKDAMEEAAKQQEEENKGGKGGKGGKGSTTVGAIAEGVEKGLGNVSVNTSVNTGEVGDGVDKAKEIITVSKLQHDMRDEQRKQRTNADAIKQSSQAIKTYMQGKMPPEMAKQFEQKIKQNGWTDKDFEAAYKRAINSQLLSKSERRKQYQSIVGLYNRVKELGLQ